MEGTLDHKEEFLATIRTNIDSPEQCNAKKVKLNDQVNLSSNEATCNTNKVYDLHNKFECEDKDISDLDKIDGSDVVSNVPTATHTIKCGYCSSWFAKVCHMAKHSLTVHTQISNVSSPPVIPKMNSSIISIQERPKRSWACPVCWRVFAKLANLRIHSRTHTGEKPYSCRECERSFSQLSTLRTHQRMHAGDRKHRCDLCMKEFLTSSNLRSHLRTHTGERPYGCGVCGRMFSDYSGMKRHEKTHSRQSSLNVPLIQTNLNNLESFNFLSNDISKALEELPSLLPQTTFANNSVVITNQQLSMAGLAPNSTGFMIHSSPGVTTQGQLKQNEVECHLPTENASLNHNKHSDGQDKAVKIESRLEHVNSEDVPSARSPLINTTSTVNSMSYSSPSSISGMQQNSFDSNVNSLQDFIADPLFSKLPHNSSMTTVLPNVVSSNRNSQNVQLNHNGTSTSAFNLSNGTTINNSLINSTAQFQQPGVQLHQQQQLNNSMQPFSSQLPLLQNTNVLNNNGPGHAMACGVGPHHINALRTNNQQSISSVPGQQLSNQFPINLPNLQNISNNRQPIFQSSNSTPFSRSQLSIDDKNILTQSNGNSHFPTTVESLSYATSSIRATVSQIVFPDQMRTDS